MFSVNPAVCCCMYLNSQEQITSVRAQLGAIGPISLRWVLQICFLASVAHLFLQFLFIFIGNYKLHTLTSQGTYELRVDMEDFENNIRYANFTTFSVGDSSPKYRLTISGYSGDAGN